VEAYVSDALGVLPQLVRALRQYVLSLASVLRAAVGRSAQIDPELERLAERAFTELRQAPLVRPSRDIAESVKERLQQRPGDPPAPSSDEEPADRE
jgi:hypothetical protein